MLFHRRKDVDLGTFDFPHSGFWAIHALTIPLAVYLGLKLARRAHRAPEDL